MAHRVAVFRRCIMVEERRVHYRGSGGKAFGPEDGAAMVRALTGNSPTEWTAALFFSAGGKFVGGEVVGRGGQSGCAMTPADVFRGAIASAASSIILAHNHPSGDPTPSVVDIEFTHRVIEAAKLLGLAVLDHLVVTEKDYCSMSALGYLNVKPAE